MSEKVVHHHHRSGGIGLAGAVFIVFLVMKLTGHIGWSWLWVTSPLWIGLGAVLGLFVTALVVAGIGLGIAAIIDLVRDRRRARLRRGAIAERNAARMRDLAEKYGRR